MTKLIVRADDLGISEGVNRGILKSIKDGYVRSTSLMVNMDAAVDGFELVKDCDIALGIHLNICLGTPCSNPLDIPSLVDETGDFFSSKVIRSRKQDTVDLKEAEIELTAQLNRFREITGREPDYFEAHAIRSENFWQAMKNVANENGLFYENSGFDEEWEDEMDIYSFSGSPTNNLGTYDGEALLQNALPHLNERSINVWVMHPGYLDQYLIDHSSYTMIRPYECAFVCSDYVKNFIEDNNIEIIDFRDISK